MNYTRYILINTYLTWANNEHTRWSPTVRISLGSFVLGWKIIINPCLFDFRDETLLDIQFRIIHFTEAARRWLARTIRWRQINVPCSSRESEFKKRKCLEETFHDFIYRLREEFPRVFLSRVKVIAIERFREYATHCWLAINDKPWIIFLIRCRGYLTDI